MARRKCPPPGSWSTSTLHMKSNDTRRHCYKCKHYRKADKFCSVYSSKCIGSSQCKYYVESEIKDVPLDERMLTKKQWEKQKQWQIAKPCKQTTENQKKLQAIAEKKNKRRNNNT